MTTNKKLISIIVPVYNAENYIAKCIESLINQTYKNIEIILVDDGSTDKSAIICDEYAKKDSRIFVLHQKNGGVSRARNNGIKIAKGDFIAFVDCDDFVNVDMYEKLLNKQQENDFDIVFCRLNEICDDKIIKVHEDKLQALCDTLDISYFVNQERFSTKNNKVHIKHCVWRGLWRSLYKKELLDDVKFDETFSMGEDVCLLIELFTKFNLRLGVVDDYLYNYVIRQGSLCRDTSAFEARINKIKSDTLNFENCISKILEKHPNKEEIVGKFLFNEYIKCYLIALNLKDKHILDDIESWKVKFNYKSCLKYAKGAINKIICFFVYHNIKFPFVLLKKLKKIFKK